jgi:hypothetical protein
MSSAVLRTTTLDISCGTDRSGGNASAPMRSSSGRTLTCCRERGGFERFYCGAPLVSANGHRLGTLCLGGSQPKEIDAHEVLR